MYMNFWIGTKHFGTRKRKRHKFGLKCPLFALHWFIILNGYSLKWFISQWNTRTMSKFGEKSMRPLEIKEPKYKKSYFGNFCPTIFDHSDSFDCCSKYRIFMWYRLENLTSNFSLSSILPEWQFKNLPYFAQASKMGQIHSVFFTLWKQDTSADVSWG